MDCCYIMIASVLALTLISIAWVHERTRYKDNRVQRGVIDQRSKDAIIMTLRHRRLVEKYKRHKRASKPHGHD